MKAYLVTARDRGPDDAEEVGYTVGVYWTRREADEAARRNDATRRAGLEGMTFVEELDVPPAPAWQVMEYLTLPDGSHGINASTTIYMDREGAERVASAADDPMGRRGNRVTAYVEERRLA